MRLWPPAFQIDRLCTQDFTIEPKKVYEHNKLHIKKGTIVVVPTIALHRNLEYFPHSHKFDPDRFSDKNKSKIMPGTYLPFGVGPRNCIGRYTKNILNKCLCQQSLFRIKICST